MIIHLQSFKFKKIIKHGVPDVDQSIVVKISVKEYEIMQVHILLLLYTVVLGIFNNYSIINFSDLTGKTIHQCVIPNLIKCS
jgi:uncharacterized membrane protein YwzB